MKDTAEERAALEQGLRTDPYAQLRVSFDPKHVARLWPWMGRNDIRYYLNGLHVERAPQGVYLVACDGHTLAVIHDAGGSIAGFDAVTFRAPAPLLNASRTAAKSRVPLRVQLHGQRLAIAHEGYGNEVSDLEVYLQPGKAVIEGTYPDWRRVIPDFSTLVRGVRWDASLLNPAYLARLEAVPRPNRNGEHGVVLWRAKDDTAEAESMSKVVVQFAGIPEMVALIMPMGADRSEEQYRARMPNLAAPAAA